MLSLARRAKFGILAGCLAVISWAAGHAASIQTEHCTSKTWRFLSRAS